MRPPHRLLAALDDIATTAPHAKVAICRELTKLHEEVFRGRASEARSHFANPRGEFTIVIGPDPRPEANVTDEELAAALAKLEDQGISGREAVDKVSREWGVGRNRVYRMWVER